MSEIKLPEYDPDHMPKRSGKLHESGQVLFCGDDVWAAMQRFARIAVELDRAPRPAVCARCKGHGVIDDNVDVDDNGGSIGTIESCPACASRPGGEAVAWMYDYCGMDRMVSVTKPPNAPMFKNVAPLYAAPAAVSEDVRELTDADLFEMARDNAGALMLSSMLHGGVTIGDFRRWLLAFVNDARKIK